jgi:uncharacterized phage protein gp47/JayE
MPIEFPTYDEIINRILADVATNLPGVDPTIFGSFLRAFSVSLGGRSFDITLLQQQLLQQFFPQTATGDFLERWAGYEGIIRLVATGASGSVTFIGTVSSVILSGTQVRSAIGELYETQAGVTLSLQTISVTGIIRSGTTATATTASGHNMASGMTVTIAGADQSEYNGSFLITVTAADAFEYTVAGSPATPATGTITVSFTGASVEVESVNTGQVVNLDSGAQLNLVSPIAGVDTTGFVQFDGIGGGTDVETDAALLVRVLQSRSNPVANFNVAAIEKQALSVAGVTRLLVKRITPRIGAVTVLFVRDNDDNIIPTGSEVQDVKDAILEILQASSDETDVVVTAPTPVTTDYTFSAISPDTPTMRTAIGENLAALYEDQVTFETDVTEDKYRGAIINTIDPDTGDTLNSFTLSSPTGDITVTTNEIGILGDVIFS